MKFLLLVAAICCLLNECGAFSAHPGVHMSTRIQRNLPFRIGSMHASKSEISPIDTTCASMDKVPSSMRFDGSLLRKAALASTIVGAGCLAAQAPAMAASPNLIDSLNESGFVQSFLLIFVSEIGDKTFFIAGLLAAKYGRLISFVGSIGALAVMTVISTILGQIFHAVPPSITQGIPFDDVVAVIAFSYFGVKTLLDASQLEAGDSSGIEEEKAEAEEAVAELNDKEKMQSIIGLLVQTFSLVFAAEIGDRSFLSTIALSAALNPVAVASGAIAAHASATGVAVVGGALMSKYLSEKVIGYIGGSLFIVFAITTALGVF
mmetsp:Transcript_28289/g.47562  ORF Transcript_28289/g.47562 Transcript_28289/m.47562 type:complete len:320 (+) Transcript_28289:96-1055(+)